MMNLRLVNIGFGNIVSADRLIAIVSPESAPIKRIVQEARESGRLIDATCGRRTSKYQVEASSVFFREQVGQALQGLAQAHVVAQHAAGLQLAQGLHPAQAFTLVGAQFGQQAGRGERRSALAVA